MIRAGSQQNNNTNNEYTYTVSKAKQDKKNTQAPKHMLMVHATSAPLEEEAKFEEHSALPMRPPTSSSHYRDDYV